MQLHVVETDVVVVVVVVKVFVVSHRARNMNFCLTMSPDTLRMRHGNIELVAAIDKKKAYDCDLYAV